MDAAGKNDTPEELIETHSLATVLALVVMRLPPLGDAARDPSASTARTAPPTKEVA